MSKPAGTFAPLLGRYRILERVGTGAMGVVYRGWDARLQREVAIKTLHPGLIRKDEARNTTRNEALALSSLKHPNIAILYDLCFTKNGDFIVMEFVEGTTLADRMAVERALPTWEVLRLGIQLSSAVQAAHEKRVVHRDIKPTNIRVTPNGILKVLDFGIARLVNGSRAGLLDEVPRGCASLPNSSDTTAIGGTIPYMAPERIRGSPADCRSDVYGIGVVLYEMVTGSHPFPAKDDSLRVDRILRAQPLPPRFLNRRIPLGLDKVILKSMHKRPERRYQSGAEVLAALREVATTSIPWTAAGQPAACALTWLALLPWDNLPRRRTLT